MLTLLYGTFIKIIISPLIKEETFYLFICKYDFFLMSLHFLLYLFKKKRDSFVKGQKRVNFKKKVDSLIDFYNIKIKFYVCI